MVKLYLPGIRMGRRTAAIAISFLLVLAVSVWGMTRRDCDQTPASRVPVVRSFVWTSDASEGIAVTFKLSELYGASRLPKDVKIRLTQSGTLDEYWQIREVNAYFIADGRRRLAIGEGPFLVRAMNAEAADDCRSWALYNLKDREYEVDFCLHKVKDGMSIDKVRTHIREQEAFTLRVDRLTGSSTYVCALP